jgi:predicted transcriptional regulator
MNSEGQNYRPDLYVVARIIKALKEKKTIHKTALATSTGLSYDTLVKYLEWMLEKNFIKINKNGEVVLTNAGSKAYEDLVKWIMKYVGQLRFPRLRPRT